MELHSFGDLAMSEIEEKRGLFYLGKQFDLATNTTGATFSLDGSHLTTHAAILGMTGSGKTGLGITLLEEALLDGVPAIILDPKGDITNLALMFPDLTSEDLSPWIAPEDAQMHEMAPEAFASQVSASWRDERTKWDITPGRVRQFRDSAEICIYTPGSDAGVLVDVLQSLQAPPGEWTGHEEEMRERIQGLVSALLGLAGIEADPVQSREHILLAHLFEQAWKAGQSLDLPTLIGQIQRPPLQRLGVFELDAFFPEKDRTALAASLNHLIASPGFEAWRQGEPLDVDSLLRHTPSAQVGGTDVEKVRASIFYLAHLDDAQRMFFVTLLLSQVRGWLRRQRGVATLRAILYFDEIFNYCPPYPKNPPSKVPLLALIKQARAMGLGVVLATQNPVDLDYKGLANIGAWFVGRLRTERDKARLLEGLESAATESGSGIDRDEIGRLLGNLPPRVFVLSDVRADHPVVFKSRQAMSYLRGPLTREEIRQLSPEKPPVLSSSPEPLVAQELEGGRGQVLLPPTLPPDVRQYFLPATTTIEWALRQWEGQTGQTILVESRQLIYEPRLLGIATVRFSDRRLAVPYQRTVTRLVPIPATRTSVDWGAADDAAVEHGSLSVQPSEDAAFAELPRGALNARTLAAFERDFAGYVYRDVTVSVMVHPQLKSAGVPNEAPHDFRERVESEVRARRDAEIAQVRSKYQREIARAEKQLRREERELEQDQADLAGRKREETVGVAESIFNFLTGRRQSYAVTYASRRRRLTQKAESEVQESEDAIADLEDMLDQLRKSLDDEVAEISQRWAAVLDKAQAITLKARKSDITVDIFGLTWVPFWRVAGKVDEAEQTLRLLAYEPARES
jgi:hypothetical protein